MKLVYYIGNWWWVETYTHTRHTSSSSSTLSWEFCKPKSFSIVERGFKIILWCNSDDELLLRNIYCETDSWNSFTWKTWNWEWGVEEGIMKMRVEMQRKCFKWLQIIFPSLIAAAFNNKVFVLSDFVIVTWKFHFYPLQRMMMLLSKQTIGLHCYLSKYQHSIILVAHHL